jgi:hypothetical protein
MRVFFDTSALVKRYLDEPGSIRVLEICREADSLVVSVICLPEMVSMLNRLIRQGTLSAQTYHQTKSLMLSDLEDADICNLTPEVIGRAIQCLENHPVRGMDGLHLGCALIVGPDLFVSSDPAQVEAARKEGLRVEAVW